MSTQTLLADVDLAIDGLEALQLNIKNWQRLTNKLVIQLSEQLNIIKEATEVKKKERSHLAAHQKAPVISVKSAAKLPLSIPEEVVHITTKKATANKKGEPRYVPAYWPMENSPHTPPNSDSDEGEKKKRKRGRPRKGD